MQEVVVVYLLERVRTTINSTTFPIPFFTIKISGLYPLISIKKKINSLLTVERIGHFTSETMRCIQSERFGVHGENSGWLYKSLGGRQTCTAVINCVQNLTDTSDERYSLCLTGYQSQDQWIKEGNNNPLKDLSLMTVISGQSIRCKARQHITNQ